MLRGQTNYNFVLPQISLTGPICGKWVTGKVPVLARRVHMNFDVIVGSCFVLQTMRVKLQPPSGSELPGYNPILPPSAITQVMLIANPAKVSSVIAKLLSG